MTAKEAREITNKRLEMLKEFNMIFAKTFREKANEKIEEAANKARDRCILKLAESIDDETINNIIHLFQKDNFSVYREKSNIVIKW